MIMSSLRFVLEVWIPPKSHVNFCLSLSVHCAHEWDMRLRQQRAERQERERLRVSELVNREDSRKIVLYVPLVAGL